MKRSIYLFFALFALTIVSCVDDYMDANPPLPLDAPYAYVNSSVLAGKDGIPLIGGEEVTFTVDIVDAPGVLNGINFIFSKGGEVVSHTFDELIGQTSGTFEVTVKAPYNLNGATTFTAEISDAQDEPKILTITEVLDVNYLHPGPVFSVTIDDVDGTAMEGDIVDVTLAITSVPSGAIGSIAVAGSAGSVNFDQAELDALIGASSGTITGSMEIGAVSATGNYDVSVAITDELQNRQVVKSDNILLICPSAADYSGTYTATASGVNGETGNEYHGLTSTTTLTQINAGQYEINDLSFGVYDQLQTYDPIDGILNICGMDVSGDASNGDGIVATGTVTEEEVPGVIILEWSNAYGDSGTVTLVKQ